MSKAPPLTDPTTTTTTKSIGINFVNSVSRAMRRQSRPCSPIGCGGFTDKYHYFSYRGTPFSRITDPLFPTWRSREMTKTSTGDAERRNSCWAARERGNHSKLLVTGNWSALSLQNMKPGGQNQWAVIESVRHTTVRTRGSHVTRPSVPANRQLVSL